jgi:hypothetical protein
MTSIKAARFSLNIFKHDSPRQSSYKSDNFFVLELPEGIPDDSEYWVFFFVERADKGEMHALNLIVQSAYVGKRERSPGGRMAKKLLSEPSSRRCWPVRNQNLHPEKSKPRQWRGSYAVPLDYPTHGVDPFGRADAVTAMASQEIT